jgi:hypothetical protein
MGGRGAAPGQKGLWRTLQLKGFSLQNGIILQNVVISLICDVGIYFIEAIHIFKQNLTQRIPLGLRGVHDYRQRSNLMEMTNLGLKFGFLSPLAPAIVLI